MWRPMLRTIRAISGWGCSPRAVTMTHHATASFSCQCSIVPRLYGCWFILFESRLGHASEGQRRDGGRDEDNSRQCNDRSSIEHPPLNTRHCKCSTLRHPNTQNVLFSEHSQSPAGHPTTRIEQLNTEHRTVEQTNSRRSNAGTRNERAKHRTNAERNKTTTQTPPKQC